MTLDLKAVEALSELEKKVAKGPVGVIVCSSVTMVFDGLDAQKPLARFERDGRTAEAKYFESLRNAAPELLALAKEALAAREWHKAWKRNCGAAFREPEEELGRILEAVETTRWAYEALVSKHQSGGG